MNKKVLGIGIALVIVIIAGALIWKNQCGEKVKPKPVDENQDQIKITEEVSEWKTYENHDLGFSFDYPSTFVLDDKSQESGYVVGLKVFDENRKNLYGESNPGFFREVSVYRWSDINNMHLKAISSVDDREYIDFEDFISDSNKKFIHVKGETFIDEKKAYLVSVTGGELISGVMFEHDGGYYRIEFSEGFESSKSEIKDKILSSFKLK